MAAWLSAPNVWISSPTTRHREILQSVIEDSYASGNLLMDAHLAALALEHGLILCSSDRDFARFPQLRWENTIQDAQPSA
ncbi:MAG: PIN domain-containing protein [Opitutales bacterium]